MIKLLRFVKRRKDLAPKDFHSRWLDTQLQAGSTLLQKAPIKKIVVSLSAGDLLGGSESFFDGMMEMYFDKKEDAHALFSSVPWNTFQKEEANLIDSSGSTGYLFADEYVTAEGSEWAAIAADPSKAKTKVIRTVKRQAGLTRDQFKHYWLNNHSQLEKTRVVKTLTRRIAATFLTGELIGETEPTFDGLASLYYDSIESAKTHFAGGSQSVMRKDEQHFVDLDYEVVRVITQEYWVR